MKCRGKGNGVLARWPVAQVNAWQMMLNTLEAGTGKEVCAPKLANKLAAINRGISYQERKVPAVPVFQRGVLKNTEERGKSQRTRQSSRWRSSRMTGWLAGGTLSGLILVE